MPFDASELCGKCPPRRDLAQQATLLLRWRLAGSGLARDQPGREHYGRTLAVAKTRAGGEVAATLIRAGLAHPEAGRRPRGGWCTPGR